MKRIATGLALVTCLTVSARSANAAVGQARTTGPHYDRNPSVLQDGSNTYLFFARSQRPCNRLQGCNPDSEQYDMYYKASSDGGKTFSPATLLALNPDGSGPFYGRTIAAVRADNGTVYVFWASGGNSNDLYVVTKMPAAPFTSPTPALLVPGTTPFQIFNIEAVSGPDGIFLYAEECCSAPGVYAYRFDGVTATARTLVFAARNLPKAIVDNQPGRPRYRMTYVDASSYPTVDVYVASSTDGLTWLEHELVVSEPAVSNWDPSLAQLPNGRYYLHFAPDEEAGAGRQRIAVTTSNDFDNWSAPHEISPGFQGGIEYWDYWPEGFVLGNKLTLYYSSERGFNENETGTGHIWTLPGFSGVNEMSNGSAEASADGISPIGWRGIGSTDWSEGGTDGVRSLTAGVLGSWVSDTIPVQPGSTYGVMADVSGTGGTVVIEQLSLTGLVVGTLTRVLSGVTSGEFATVDDVIQVPQGVSAIRIRLRGGLLSSATFDDVRVWKQ